MGQEAQTPIGHHPGSAPSVKSGIRTQGQGVARFRDAAGDAHGAPVRRDLLARYARRRSAAHASEEQPTHPHADVGPHMVTCVPDTPYLQIREEASCTIAILGLQGRAYCGQVKWSDA
jgi:hypothetical protein